MRSDVPRGNVLVITDDETSAVRLVRWVEATGEKPVLLSGNESFLIEEGDDETVDLVITDLDTDEPSARTLVERLAGGDLFPGVAQLHLLRDLSFREAIQKKDAEIAAVVLPSPPEASDFQARVRLAAQVGRLRRELARTSSLDPLTGLYSRRFLLRRLEEEFFLARRHRVPLSVVLFDIDGLRFINNRFGEEVGDSVISAAANAIREFGRKTDVAGRVGEESFALILPVTRFRGAAILANKVRKAIESLDIRAAGTVVEPRLSGGIAAYPENPAIEDAPELLDRAETAMDQAKERGGNRIYIDEGAIRSDRRLVLIVDSDSDLLDLAEDLLSEDNFQVVRAGTAKTALESVRFRCPELVIADLQIEAAAEGSHVIEEIRALHPDCIFPVIGLSRDPEFSAAEISRLGVDHFITKPFSLSVLRSVVRELIED